MEKVNQGSGGFPRGWNKKQMMFEFCGRVFSQFDFEAKALFSTIALGKSSRCETEQAALSFTCGLGFGYALGFGRVKIGKV